MTSKIKQMNMKEIVEKLGFPTNLEEFKSTYRYDVSKESIIKFEEKIIKLSKSGKSNFKDYMNIIIENQSIFDKEIYFLHITRLLEQEYSDAFLEKESKDKKVFRLNDFENDLIKKNELLKFCRRLLSTTDVVEILVSKADDESDYTLISSSMLYDNPKKVQEKKDKIYKQLDKIDTIIGLDEVLEFITPEDLSNICKYENLGVFFVKENYSKLNEIQSQDSDSINVLYDIKQTQKKEFEEFIRKNIEYIDLDKMLLLASAVFFYKNEVDLENCTISEISKLKSFTEKVKMLVQNKKTSIKNNKIAVSIDIKLVESFIKKLNKHFINGKFYNTEEINEISNKILNGELNINFLTKEEFINTMNFSNEDINKIIFTSPNSIDYFIETELQTRDEIKQRILSLEKINSNILVSAISLNLVTDDEFLYLYSTNKIDINDIKEAKEKLKSQKDLEKIVSSKKLIELYLSSNKEKEFERYKRIYKTLKIDDKTLEKKKKIANEILDYSLDLLDDDKLLVLYHMGLIPIETVLDISKNETLENLYIKSELNPIDVRKMYDNGTFTKQGITNILKNADISQEEKISLIFSTFSKPEDDSLVREYISNIFTTEEENINKFDNISDKNKRLLENLEEKDITEIRKKWNFISQKDLEYSQKYFGDGYILFYLPNKEKYILEKMFSSDMKIAYGSATYVFDKSVFEKSFVQI